MNLQINGTYFIGGDGAAHANDSVQVKIVSLANGATIVDWTNATFTGIVATIPRFAYTTVNPSITTGDIVSFRVNSDCCSILTTDQTIAADDVQNVGQIAVDLDFSYTDAPDPV